MKLIRNIDHYKTSGPLCLALGNFDGVHLGHQRLIEECVTFAREQNGVAAAYIFEPHPAKVIKPALAPKLLVTADRKAELLAALGLDLLIYTPFTSEVAQSSPEEFVRNILVEKLNVRQVVIGFNYSFGYRGAGTPELLVEMGRQYGFNVRIVEPVEVGGQVVSSSSIRQAMEDGNIELATAMLGYFPILSGKVIKGEQRGSRIGFPTANLYLDPDLTRPSNGVYAAIARVEQRSFKAVVNIGSKPTFHDEYPTTVEVHLIDFQENIYDKNLELLFLKKIRDERKFNGIEELIEQIGMDREMAASFAVIPS